MSGLIPVAGRTMALDIRQLIGVYKLDEHRCVLLDCGYIDIRDTIETLLAEAGLTVVGMLGTHTHFDHFGNGAYFQKHHGASIALPLGEAELCRTYPTLKGYLFVYSAGEVMSDPQLREMPCYADRVIRPEEDEIEFCGARFGIVHTPGHSPDHISVLTPDGVLYTGDALTVGAHLKTSKIPYAYNLRQYMESLDVLRGVKAEKYLVAHKGVVDAPFEALIDENLHLMERQLQIVSDVIDHTMSFEEILTAVRDELHIRVDTPRKAENMERFLRPYLECLIDDGTHRLALRGTGTLCYEPNR